MSLSGVLSPKEQARLKKVREDLAAGRNPYTSINERTLGVGVFEDKTPASEREVSPEEWARREKRWSERTEGTEKVGRTFKYGDYPDSPLKGDTPLPLRDPSQLVCSFCQASVPYAQATRGISNPRKIIKVEELPGAVPPDDQFREVITHVADKLIACPNCVHRIKPLTKQTKDKDGNVVYEDIVNQGIQFDETD